MSEHEHEGTRAADKPGSFFQRAYYCLSTAKMVWIFLAALVSIIAGTAVWANERPSKTYVDEAVKSVASADIKVHQDYDKRFDSLKDALAANTGAQGIQAAESRALTAAIQGLQADIRELRNGGMVVKGPK